MKIVFLYLYKYDITLILLPFHGSRCVFEISSKSTSLGQTHHDGECGGGNKDGSQLVIL